jgi:Secretion system C-terminal sorting domain
VDKNEYMIRQLTLQFFIAALFCCTGLIGRAQPANNGIFLGGTGDGGSGLAFAIAANQLYAGSTGDGMALGSNGVVANSIFAGGAGDGQTVATNGVLSNVIFLGGSGDGHHFAANSVVPNFIFAGSVGDGFNTAANTTAPNLIFYGGEGDGWSAIVTPLGPLPVTLLNFTAVVQNKSHLIKWTTTQELNTHYFDVEQSADSRVFNRLARVAATATNGAGAAYRVENAVVLPGNNFYRLKMVDRDGSFTYSNILLLKHWLSATISLYPNPTASALHVNLSQLLPGKTVQSFIYDAAGKLINSATHSTGATATLQVATLPAGIYVLKLLYNGEMLHYRFSKAAP